SCSRWLPTQDGVTNCSQLGRASVVGATQDSNLPPVGRRGWATEQDSICVQRLKYADPRLVDEVASLESFDPRKSVFLERAIDQNVANLVREENPNGFGNRLRHPEGKH